MANPTWEESEEYKPTWEESEPAEYTAPPLDLTANPLDGMPEEERKVVEPYMTDDDKQMINATRYYDDKFSTNHTPEMIQAQIKYEYGENATAAIANEKNSAVQRKMTEYAEKTSQTFKSPEIGQSVMEAMRLKKDIPAPVGMMAPGEARTFREKKLKEYEEFVGSLPEESRIEIERSEIRQEYDTLKQQWEGKDKESMPSSVKEKMEDLDAQLGITDTLFEQRVLGGRAKRSIDVFNFSRYSTHKEQQIALDVDAGSKESAQSKIDRLHEMQNAASETLPHGERLGGKVWYGAIGSAGPMAESIAAGTFTGGIADKAYWALQGQGSVISDYVRESETNIADMSDKDYARLQSVSKATGALYAATEFIGGVYGLQKIAPVKKAQQKLVAEAMKNPAMAEKLIKGGGKFAWEWLKENTEEGIQGFLTELGKQIIGEDVDVMGAIDVGGKQFVEAAPGTLGIIGGGKLLTVGDTNRFRKQNTDAQLDEKVVSGELEQELVDVVKTPENERDEAVSAYNDYILTPEEEAMSEDAMTTAQKLKKDEGSAEAAEAQEPSAAEEAIRLDEDIQELVNQVIPSPLSADVSDDSGWIALVEEGKKTTALVSDEAANNLPEGLESIRLSWENNAVYRSEDAVGRRVAEELGRVYSKMGDTQQEVLDSGPVLTPEDHGKIGLLLGYNKDEVSAYVANEKQNTPPAVVSKEDARAEFDAWKAQRAEPSAAEEGVEEGEIGLKGDEKQEDTKPSGDTIGISRGAENILRKARGAQERTAPETRAQDDVLKEALDGNYSANADARAAEIVSVRHGVGSRPAPITDVEVAGALIRKAEIANEIDAKIEARNDALESDNQEAFDTAQNELDSAYHAMDILTKAIDTSISENARGMAMMARFIDKKSFKLADVINNAKTVKRGKLTPVQQEGLEKLAADLKAVQDLRAEKLEAITDAEAKVLEEFASDAVSEMLSTIKIRRTKAEIKKERSRIKKDITKIGYRMNDITGITAETAKSIRELAMNYIHDGAITLQEIKEKFMSETSGFTEHDLYSALGGRVGENAKRAKSEAQLVMEEIKKQSSLSAQIIEAMDGVFDPISPTAKTSEEVKDLRNKLNLLKASVVNSEYDDRRVDSILDSITEIEKMIELKYRKIKVVRKKTKDLVEAEKLLSVANKELRAQDRIAILEELLRTDGKLNKKHIDRSETSQRLEEFRAQIMGLKQLIVKKNAPRKKQEAYKKREKALDAQIKQLTEEVEQFIRTVVPKKTSRKEMVSRKEKRAELQEAKRDQDNLAELFDTLRNRRTPKDKEVVSKSDKYGYKAMIQNVREDIQNQEWHKEWKQTRDEASKNERSKKAIAEMEERIKNEDYEGFITPKQVLMVKNDDLRQNKLKEHRLKKEINERIRKLKPKTWMDIASEIWQIPRSAKLTLDVGHIWRQGGFILSNPRKMNALDFTKMSLKNFNEENADAWDLWVLEHPSYESAKKDGLRIIEKGEQLQGVERLLDDDLLEKIPKVGDIVKASARTQLTSLNVLRLTWYDGYLQRNPEATDKERQEMVTALN